MSYIQTITYNGFTFPYTKLDYTSTVIYAEDGQTHLGTQYFFNVSGVLAGEQSPDQTLATYICNMRSALQEPRKEFKVGWGTAMSPYTYIVFDFKDTDDDDFGPKPGELRLFRFSGGQAATYSWSISIFTKECWGAGCDMDALTSVVLAVMRRYEHTIDSDGLTTRTMSGKLILSGTALQAGFSADFYRFIVAPPIPLNFHRDIQSYEQSEDGRELTFSITDSEVIYTLPNPISNGQANFTVRLADLGAMVYYTLNGWFSAPVSVPKSMIIQKIGDLVNAKFPVSAPGLIWESRELTEAVYSPNRIDFSISASSAGGTLNNGTLDLSIGLDYLTVSPPNSNGQSWPIYPDGGDISQSSGLLAPVPIAWDACSGNSLNQLGLGSRGTLAYSLSGTPTPPQGTYPSPNQISQAHKDAPYVAYNETISYEIDNGIQCFYPKIASTGGPGGDLGAAIFQQVRNPVLHVIQAGYASRVGPDSKSAPIAAAPWLLDNGGTRQDSNAAITDCFVSAVCADPVGDGSNNRYTIHWRYVGTLANTLTVGSGKASLTEAEPNWPLDPRRTLTDPEELISQTLPDGAIYAAGYGQ